MKRFTAVLALLCAGLLAASFAVAKTSPGKDQSQPAKAATKHKGKARNAGWTCASLYCVTVTKGSPHASPGGGPSQPTPGGCLTTAGACGPGAGSVPSQTPSSPSNIPPHP